MLLLNFWTLFCVLFHSYLLQKREAFLIEAFDVDPMLPSDALELFVKDSAGQAQRSWLLQCAEQQRLDAGVRRLTQVFWSCLMQVLCGYVEYEQGLRGYSEGRRASSCGRCGDCR